MSEINKTVEGLVEVLEPVKRMRAPARMVALWVFSAVVYTGLITFILGARPDLSEKLGDPVYISENLMMLVMALSAVYASCVLMVPDMRGRQWVAWAALLPLGVFVLWSFFRAYTEGLHLQAPHWSHCFEDGLLFGVFPAVITTLICQKARTTAPYVMAMMNVLAVAGFGYIGLRITCINDTVGHAGIYHLFPFAVCGMLLGLAARRIYSW